MFKMGSTVKDKITGFKGIVIGKCEYITGCDQFAVQPKIKADGTVPDSKWLDVNRLDAVEGEQLVVIDNSVDKGPACSAPSI